MTGLRKRREGLVRGSRWVEDALLKVDTGSRGGSEGGTDERREVGCDDLDFDF